MAWPNALARHLQPQVIQARERAQVSMRFMVEPFRAIWGQWREVVDQWTAVDAGVGVVCSSFGLVGARRAGSRSIRRRS